MACCRGPRHHTSRPSKRESAGIFLQGLALPTSTIWYLAGRDYSATFLPRAQIQAVKKTIKATAKQQGTRNRRASGVLLPKTTSLTSRMAILGIAAGRRRSASHYERSGSALPARRFLLAWYSLGVGTFGYAFLFAPQRTSIKLGINFNTDRGMLNPNTRSSPTPPRLISDASSIMVSWSHYQQWPACSHDDQVLRRNGSTVRWPGSGAAILGALPDSERRSLPG